ncbi:hypothetical protein [Saccharibacillus endophyticus]|uniref:DUF4375 domain-containing protein n=1 Tax=Saccharibacillus endophyticus TaxID=2060666 RepID=A0ABQ1ZIZ1_9BACL|nr:hypothetical protein [Saccharibacillus endophyticus]GGH68434.1 hypothetical protein GCM10007362_02440 [Saccharibacillus endophyticus]
MKYAATYLDRYFDSIEEYGSKVELMTLAKTGGAAMSESAWIRGIGELMNWQAMSERSGVWTYYESVNPQAAETTVLWLESLDGSEGFALYAQGLNRYEDQILMEQIDHWIEEHRTDIDNATKRALLMHKKWFYEELDV